ncbi:MAG: P27 family phage terminase small subunit [Rhodanobacteraceae bacterium]|nr:P27 family phage terminase small subunit [Rhodanobacteraceae bacterium]
MPKTTPSVRRTAGEPTAPPNLSPLALAHWNRVCSILRARGQLSADSQFALEGLVDALVDREEVMRDIRENGRTEMRRMSDGVVRERKRRLYVLLPDLQDAARKWLRQFGLTDASLNEVLNRD